jgi:tetratricopeptide (TPR) repeat protein
MKWALPKHTWARAVLIVAALVAVAGIAYGAYAIWAASSQKNTTQQEAQEEAATSSDESITSTVTQEDRDASKLVAEGDAKGAAQIYVEKAEKVDTSAQKATLYTQAASIYVNAGDTDSAFDIAKKAYDLGNPSTGTISTLAMLYERRGEYAKAIELNKELVTMLKSSEEGAAYASQYEAHIKVLEAKL